MLCNRKAERGRSRLAKAHEARSARLLKGLAERLRVPVECREPVPDRPVMPTEALAPGVALFELVQAALAEISRVLAPGGVFVASTFMDAGAPLGQIIGDEAVRPLRQVSSDLRSGI